VRTRPHSRHEYALAPTMLIFNAMVRFFFYGSARRANRYSASSVQTNRAPEAAVPIRPAQHALRHAAAMF